MVSTEVSTTEKTDFNVIIPEAQPAFMQPRFETGVPVDLNNPTVKEVLLALQENGGRIPYSRFMEISLTGKDGYYSTGKAQIGKQYESFGEVKKEATYDFTTAPEASPLFGATIGNSMAKVWNAMGKPEKFRVVEMGAGNGTLADAFLRWTQKFEPEFFKVLNYTILDYGDLIKKQQSRLQGFNNVEWVQGSALNLPFDTVVGAFISNELPDTFPIERVTKLNGELKQKYITIENGQWVELWDKPSGEVRKFIDDYSINIQDGVEEPINIGSVIFQQQVDKALEKGVVLTIDYGKFGEVGRPQKEAVHFYDRSRAYSKGMDLRPYQSPGDTDITADVNFNPMLVQAEKDGLTVSFKGTQAEFLTTCGIYMVGSQLKSAALESKSWKDIVYIGEGLGWKLMEALVGYDEADGFGTFPCMVVSKGIEKNVGFHTDNQDILRYKCDCERGMETVTLHMGEPRQIIYINTPGKESTWFRLDERGRCHYSNFKSLLQSNNGTVFTKEDGTAVLDFSDTKQFKTIVEASGYIFES